MRETMTPLTIVFLVLGFIAVALRYTARIAILRRYGIEELFIGVAMASSLATGICQQKQLHYFIGISQRTHDDVVMSFKYLYAGIITYNVCLCSTKLAILLLYRRVFSLGRTRIMVNALIAFVVALYIATIFTGIFNCIPIHAFWRSADFEGARCVDRYSSYFANASLNIATDVAIVVLPIPVVRTLPIPKAQKISLLAILVLGGFVCIVSGLRLHAFVTFWKTPEETTIHIPRIVYWSNIELNVGIVCACLPTLRPLLKKFSLFQSSQSGSYSLQSNSTSGSPQVLPEWDDRSVPSPGTGWNRTPPVIRPPSITTDREGPAGQNEEPLEIFERKSVSVFVTVPDPVLLEGNSRRNRNPNQRGETDY